MPRKRVYIQDKISGRLKTSQVQYTYRYYNKYANTTQLAPLTNKIQIIDSSRSKEIGNAEDTETSMGLQISIDTSEFSTTYKRLQVYRLSYIVPNQDSEIALIYDGEIKEGQSTFILNDVGIDPLQLLTIEEFSAMSGVMLIPQVIEQNQEYMFCSNVNDDTIIKNLEIQEIPKGEGWFKEVKAKVVLATELNGAIPNEGNYTFNQLGGDFDVSAYLTERNINSGLASPSYNNIITSSLLRSLRRGETYRYGIVYYDKYGRRSDVKTIGDYEVNPISGTNMPFGVENIDGKDILVAYPVGVKIKIPQLKEADDVNPEDIIGCQIVRRSSSEVYQKTLIQVALARPLQQGLCEITNDITPSKQSPFYPSGFLSVNNLTIYPTYYTPSGIDWNRYGVEAKELNASTVNRKLFQIFSSEIDFRRDDVLSRLNISDTTITEQFYLPAEISLYKSGTFDSYYFQGLSNVHYSENGDIQEIDRQTVGPADEQEYVVNASVFNVRADVIYLIPSTKQHDDDKWSYKFVKTNPYTQLFEVGESENIIPKINSLLNNNIEFTGDIHIIPNRRTEFYGSMIGYGSGGSIPRTEVDLIVVTNSRSISTVVSGTEDDNIGIDRASIKKLSIEDKKDFYYIFNYFKSGEVLNSNFNDVENIKVSKIKDVKIPNWNDGFDRLTFDDDGSVLDATKQYTGFNTSIDEYQYNNWYSFGKYDAQPGREDSPNQKDDQPFCRELLGVRVHYTEWLNNYYGSADNRSYLRNGYIGPGPSCFLLTTDKETGSFPSFGNQNFYTSVCNIQHAAKQDNIESDEHTQFFGFGNYFDLTYKDGELVSGDNTELTVFDGDIYITPHEFTTMYKAYNFESIDTLQSMQITNYIPLESKVNTYFDYGMNLRNTDSANLIYEPGSIDGITTQERPAHQYNMIYSDNDASNDVFTLISTDKNETNMFKQRAYFSELKSNGEFIDNFLIFKALSFIDVDSKYGQITEMYTDKNILYYWQDHAFGKFSVNERSLINDQNGNTIMLGQSGILSRYDYISTKYGMRLQDFCARNTEKDLYWVDMNNKAVIAANSGQAVNYGEQTGVQNLINDKIDMDVIPNVDYDIQNNELLCQFFGDHSQLVFNTKYNIPTSIYNRMYDETVYIKNHLYGLYKDENGLNVVKYNYLDDMKEVEYLAPMKLDFVINPNVSVVKVFDNQQIVPIKRSAYDPEAENKPFDNIELSFETDLYSKQDINTTDMHTDREGNLLYAVPRFGNENYGNRMRGKWMKVSIQNDNPTDYTTVSHVITKFRQSYS